MKKLLAAILFMVASSANAGVVYTWHTTYAAQHYEPFEIQMSIVFADEVVQSGSIDFLTYCDPYDIDYSCGDAVTSFHFSGGTQRDIYFSPEGTPYDTDFIFLSIVGQFDNGYFLGDIHARTNQTEIVIYNGDVWFMESTIPGDICNLGETCQGDLGVIMADQEPEEVPEPSSIALLGLALSGLVIARRQSKSVTTFGKI